MKIHTTSTGAVTFVKPHGPILKEDGQSLCDCASMHIREQLGRVVLDLEDVPYMDSEGLEALVSLEERFGSCGRVLKLCHVGETLREVFEITGCLDAVEFFDDPQSAARSFL